MSPPQPVDEPREGFTALGRILRPHGIRGELRVQAFAPGAPNMQRGRDIYLRGERRRVTRARDDRGAWILQLEGITDRTVAEQLRGMLIEAADEDVQRDDAESFFLHELIGLRAETPEGEFLGTVVEVLQPGANDVYVVNGPKGELLIPAIGEAVHDIDLARRVMTITPLPALGDEPQ